MAINTSVSNNMPIEYQISMAMERISDDATQDLRSIVEKVDNNRMQKDMVRSLLKSLELYKIAVNNNNSHGPGGAMEQRAAIVGLLTKPVDQGGFGLAADSAEVKAARNLPHTLPTDAAERDKVLTNQVKSMETLLEGRAQSLSDLGQKFQFQLTEANNIFQRANKAQADVSKSGHDTSNAIIKHLAG